jgi:soluble cytochrome b562
MGVMTTLVMNNIVNPFRGFGRGFYNFCEVVGYSRAAAELARQGYMEEAKACMMQVKRLRSK